MTRPVTRTQRARSLRPAGAKSASARAAASEIPPVSVAEQRVYHVTHIDNLASILAAGRLLAADGGVDFTISADVSSAENRAARLAQTAPGTDVSIAAHVPFYLSPDATLWDTLRSREADPRLASGALSYASPEFVILVSAVKSVISPDVDGHDTSGAVVSDGDPTGVLTRFATGRSSAERMVRTLRGEDENERILDAELLIPGEVTVEAISVIGVANDRMRGVVRAALKDSGFSPKVVVHPPWFRRADEIPE